MSAFGPKRTYLTLRGEAEAPPPALVTHSDRQQLPKAGYGINRANLEESTDEEGVGYDYDRGVCRSLRSFPAVRQCRQSFPLVKKRVALTVSQSDPSPRLANRMIWRPLSLGA